MLMTILNFQRMMVDEADIDPLGSVRAGAGGGPGGKRGSESPRSMPPKRKAGPLPPHIKVRRPSTPSPASSPRAPLSPLSPLPPLTPPPPPAAPSSPAAVRRPTSPLAPVPSDLPSGRPPEVNTKCKYALYGYPRGSLLFKISVDKETC